MLIDNIEMKLDKAHDYIKKGEKKLIDAKKDHGAARKVFISKLSTIIQEIMLHYSNRVGNFADYSHSSIGDYIMKTNFVCYKFITMRKPY